MNWCEGQPEGMSRDPLGGLSTKLDTRFDLLPGAALIRIAEVFAEGAKKYAEDNWRFCTFETHIQHALEHWFRYKAGDRSEDHIGHMATRTIMALEVLLVGNVVPGKHDKDVKIGEVGNIETGSRPAAKDT